MVLGLINGHMVYAHIHKTITSSLPVVSCCHKRKLFRRKWIAAEESTKLGSVANTHKEAYYVDDLYQVCVF